MSLRRAMRPVLGIAVVILLALTAIPFVAQSAEWEPAAVRSFSSSATSRGLTFHVTVSFKAPDTATTVFLADGRDGATWFTPDDWESFRVTGQRSTPEAFQYNNRASWLWLADDYAPGQTITVEYDVEVATTVAYHEYTIDGRIGTGDLQYADIGGSTAITVEPFSVEPMTSQPTYQRTQTVVVAAVATYPDGSPVVGATVQAVIDRTAQTLPMGATATPGTYEASLPLKSDSATGAWRATVSANDGMANTNTASVDFSVGLAELRVDVGTDRSLYLGGDPVSITAIVTYPIGTPVDDALVTALMPTEERFPLVRDPSVPGRYTATYELKPDAPIGTWPVLAEAEDQNGNTGAGTSTFEVGFAALIIAAVETDLAYEISDTIHLRATAAYPDGSPLTAATAVATFAPGGAAVSLQESDPGTYVGDYRVAPGAAFGPWTVQVDMTHPSGTRARGTAAFVVERATFSVSATLSSVSARRLDTFQVSARVAYPDGTPVSGAEVTARLEPGEGVMTLAETATPGTYSASRALPVDEPTGARTATVRVDHRDGLGESTETFAVSPTIVRVTISSSKGTFLQRDAAAVEATVEYSDGSAVSAASATITLSDGVRDVVAAAAMARNEQGIFRYAFSLAADARPGPWRVTVVVSDAHSNTGTGTAGFVVEPYQEPTINLALLLIVIGSVAAVIGATVGVILVRRGRRGT